jgi:pimeloyl-ACP methyl ester carboxylesterase
MTGGSAITANSALLRPDLFAAVGVLSVPYAPHGAHRPSEVFARAGVEEEFYVSYFQPPGVAEAEIEEDVRSWLAGIYAALSGDAAAAPQSASVFTIPRGGKMRDRLPRVERLPGWLSERDLDAYAGEFERRGLAGPLNRYRNVDRDWEDLAVWDGVVIDQPSILIAGERDASTNWMRGAIDAHARTLPGVVSSHVLAGRGHWIQQEAEEKVSGLLIDWLRSTSLPAG